MWQDILIFTLAAGSVWFLGRQFFRTSGKGESGCGCAGCSSCDSSINGNFVKDCNQ